MINWPDLELPPINLHNLPSNISFLSDLKLSMNGNTIKINQEKLPIRDQSGKIIGYGKMNNDFTFSGTIDDPDTMNRIVKGCHPQNMLKPPEGKIPEPPPSPKPRIVNDTFF